MKNKEEINQNEKENKVYDIRERIFNFSLRVFEISDMLPQKREGDIVKTQFVSSGTSIGANMEEADGSVTKKDFLNKVVIARKEAKESRYWLRLISEKFVNKENVKEDLQELQEIINILSAIINKTKNTN
jgi:four helix bundle protein